MTDAQAGRPGPVTESDAGLRGKVLVIDIWGTWCPACQQALPHLVLEPVAGLIGAAVGTALGSPGNPVVCLTGDGSFLMTMGELETVVRLGLPMVVVVYNDDQYEYDTVGLPFLRELVVVVMGADGAVPLIFKRMGERPEVLISHLLYKGTVAQTSPLDPKYVELISMAVHVGDIRTCVLHPASSTHRQLSAEEQIAANIRPEAIRLSTGLEDVRDLIEDLDTALNKA